MELSKQDLIEIIDGRLKVFKGEMKEVIEQTTDDRARLIIDQNRSEILASEARQDKKMEVMEKRIIDTISDVVGEGVIPQIEEHEVRLVKLEQKLAV